MAIICRMFELPAESANRLQADPGSLAEARASSKEYGDVYRYWHAIEYLLMQHSPDSAAARWLSTGTTVSAGSGEMPPARLLSANDLTQLDRLLRGIEPEHLMPHYDAAAMDAAGVYPGTWQEWEEDFDPLGQVLEHYYFLQSRVQSCTQSGNSLLLVFEELPDGSV